MPPLNFSARTVATDPDRAGGVIVDHLPRHQSASLVRWVAATCGIPADFGVNGAPGRGQSMATRAAVVRDPTQRIPLVSLPKHPSCLTQVDLGLRMLVRRVLKRASCTSTAELRARIVSCIDYFNRVLAQPFTWTDTGRPLVAYTDG